jgi:hypothetical protein
MRSKQAIFALAACALQAACTNRAADDVSPASTVACRADTADKVTFSQHIMPILQNNCAITGCHTGTTPTGNLNLDASVAYANLLDARKGYVDTNNAKGSLLYSQMTSVSAPMPPTGQLDSCSVKLVLKWITQHAPNN